MSKPAQYRALATGRIFTVKAKRKYKQDWHGSIVMVHLDGGVIQMSIRADLIDMFFEKVK